MWIEGPAKTIEAVSAELSPASDEEVLRQLAAFERLPDESDRRWDDEQFWYHIAYRLLGTAEVARRRKLRPAVRLILERVCHGDPGETMRSLRHVFEDIYKPDWTSLADEYFLHVRSPHPGTRYWAADGLLVLDDARAVPVFEALLYDPDKGIRHLAAIGLKRLLHPNLLEEEAEQRRREQEEAHQRWLIDQSEKDAHITDRRCPNCGEPLPSYRRTCKYCGAVAPR